MFNQWWGVQEGDSWGSEKNPEGGRICPSNSLQPMGAWRASRRGPLGWGKGMANLMSPYQLEGKGAWGRCVPPFPFVPWGYSSLEPGEKGSFWRLEGGVTSSYRRCECLELATQVVN